MAREKPNFLDESQARPCPEMSHRSTGAPQHMDGNDSGWMNSLDFGQRLLKEPRPCRVGWQRRETCSYFQGKGSSTRFWNFCGEAGASPDGSS